MVRKVAARARKVKRRSLPSNLKSKHSPKSSKRKLDALPSSLARTKMVMTNPLRMQVINSVDVVPRRPKRLTNEVHSISFFTF